MKKILAGGCYTIGMFLFFGSIAAICGSMVYKTDHIYAAIFLYMGYQISVGLGDALWEAK